MPTVLIYHFMPFLPALVCVPDSHPKRSQERKNGKHNKEESNERQKGLALCSTDSASEQYCMGSFPKYKANSNTMHLT